MNTNRREFMAGMAACVSLSGTTVLGDKPAENSVLANRQLSDDDCDRLRQAFQHGIERNVIPGGNLLLIHQGETVFREAFGVADIESKRPFRVTTPCRIASLTKPHTATTLVMLAEQEKLALDVPVATYLPVFNQSLGFNIIKKRADGTAARVRHTGASGTLAFIDFDRDLIAVVLTQVPQTQTMPWRKKLLKTMDTIVGTGG